MRLIETGRMASPDPRAVSDAHIGLRALADEPAYASPGLQRAAPLLDRLLGIRALDRIYRDRRMHGLPPFEFVECTLDALAIGVAPGPTDWMRRVPEQGPLLLVSNHPYGGAEALALAQALRPLRTDIKFLANSGLKVFRELRPLLIGVNPLKVTQKNLGAIRQCESHLADGGVLVLFPAGRVSSRPRGETRIQDAAWNRLVGRLAQWSGATLLPVFFHGGNSAMFHLAGALWDPLKMLMLPREFLKLRGRTLHFTIGRAQPSSHWRHMPTDALTRHARAMTYWLETQRETSEGLPPAADAAPEPLAPLTDPDRIECELAALPARQRLLDHQHFTVYYAKAAQIPLLMNDIARERERVFRMHDEGSGQPHDSDAYDAVYVQLFVWDRRSRTLVGAYRLGHADQLRSSGDTYLAHMFAFDPAFYEQAAPSLEMGRSFVVPEHQRHFYSLYLLWRGIGRYLALHPRYRRLYGTVSLSRQYHAGTIAMICDALIEPATEVVPRLPLVHPLHAEWLEYRRFLGKPDLLTLSACVRAVEPSGRDLPILLKHYMKLGARFHAVGIDPHFNRTPGLLLSVDMDAVPFKLLETFLAGDATAYLAGARSEGTTSC